MFFIFFLDPVIYKAVVVFPALLLSLFKQITQPLMGTASQKQLL